MQQNLSNFGLLYFAR